MSEGVSDSFHHVSHGVSDGVNQGSDASPGTDLTLMVLRIAFAVLGGTKESSHEHCGDKRCVDDDTQISGVSLVRGMAPHPALNVMNQWFLTGVLRVLIRNGSCWWLHCR